tara:strand:+ start:2247 stop:2999 length:753 start_codon:yes stop_codon:yes gene_type:complete
MNKKVILQLFLILTSFTLVGQQTVFEETVVKYNTEFAGGVLIHTNGFGANFRYGKFLTGFKQRMYQLEITNWKSSREVKSFNPFYDDVKGYVLGKLNTVTMVRPSIGVHKAFISKQSLSGVSINYTALFGPTFAFLKPVYLEIGSRSDNSSQLPYSIISTERYDPDIHKNANIYGRAPFLKGLSELTVYPGLHTKLGINFEYANTNDVLKAIEVNLTADAFLKELPVMAFSDNQQFFLTLSINLLYGVKK